MDSSLKYQQAVATEVGSAIERAGRSTLSVAEGTTIPRTTLIRRLKGGSPFTVIELAEIATFLGTTPVELLERADHARSLEVAS